MMESKYRPNQVVKITLNWAKDIPPRPIQDVAWDECWHCYTYAFPLALIRFEEHDLELSGDPDMTPEEWIKQYHESRTVRT